MEEHQNSLRMKRVRDVRWLSIFPVLDGALKEWDALTMFTYEKQQDVCSIYAYDTMFDVFVLLGCRTVRTLLFKLHLSVKMIQIQDFIFEDLAHRIKEFRIFVNDTYIHPAESRFGGSLYQAFLDVDGRSPL